MSWRPPTSLEIDPPFELDVLDRVFSTIVERWSEHDGDRECIVQDDGVSVTYRLLNQRASAIAAGLREHGIGVGDRVATLVANDVRVIYIGTALSKLGAVEVPVNPALVGQSLSHLLADAAPKAVIVAPGHREAVEAALSADSSPIIIQAGPEGGPAPESGDVPTLDEMLADESTVLATDPSVRANMPASIMYTSGTTGLPKGALLPHHHNYRIAQRSAGAFGLTGEDTLISILPQFHGGGRYMNTGACLLAGARCGFVRRFSGKEFFNQARQFNATVMHGIVTVGHFLLAQEPSPRDREHSITRGLLVPCPPSVADPFTERFGIEVFQGYASTEGNISVMNLDGPKAACGKPHPPYRVRIVDEYDRPVPAGVTGEIVVSCDEPWSTFSGYWNQPEMSLEVMRNFGLHTGDGGYFDENGYLWFADRIKDMIRRRGENVAAQTVEDVVNGVDEVLESAAYPVPSRFGEDEIAISVVLRPGYEVSATEIIARCRENLPRFAVPRFVRIIQELPKTETGKIQKFKLKKLGTDGAEEFPEERR
ncbi:crotonobetaine/carnitine-CoA ligase [Amycolatopsis marina]|uniref:Crotonobetaine/carnitine-CoA ligase n=1 Tax=Amycolatopsis marina TaxID=490629 RepID=A0A1I0YIK0_9PSEU|nr:AMP-binding protein [Amycolatopsis marina]SFB13189.1 crotonobetaine/carnitine-CoA ligase [Amycolatopsis marina]